MSRLSTSESSAIRRYTGLDYGRAGSAGAAEVNSAVQKLAPVRATTYRFQRYSPQMDWWTPGASVRFSSATGTTMNKPFREFGGTFNGGEGERICLMQINGRSGRSIAGLSAYPNEREVMFPAGTKLQVVRRAEQPNAVYVELREV